MPTTEAPSTLLQNSTPPTRRGKYRYLLALVSLALLASSCLLPTGPGSREFTSKEHVLIKPTAPGNGLRFTEKFLLLDNQPGELLWMTSASLDITPKLVGDFLNKAEISLLRPHRHLALHKLTQPIIGSIFRFSPGTVKVELPAGFGLPVNSNEPCNLVTDSQASHGGEFPAKVQFRAKLNYLRDRGRKEPMTALFCAQATSFVSYDSRPRYYDIAKAMPETHGPGTSPHRPATAEAFQDSLGQQFAPYWLVPPGQQETRNLVSPLLVLRQDTRLHCATAHLLPYGVSVQLLDLTEGQPVVTLGWEKSGVLEQFRSTEGVPLFKDHHYEMVTVYNNTSDSLTTGAASLTLYLADQEFHAENP